MDRKQSVKQVLDFNKRMFDNTFNMMATLQDGADSLMARFVEKSNLLTPEGKKIIGQMSDSYKKGRNDIKSMADDNFRRASEYFVSSKKKN